MTTQRVESYISGGAALPLREIDLQGHVRWDNDLGAKLMSVKPQPLLLFCEPQLRQLFCRQAGI